MAQLSQVHKVMENWIAEQLMRYLHDFQVIAKRQYAYQTGGGTKYVLTDFADLINTKLNEKKHVVVLFVNFSKAFDTLEFDQILEALDCAGIRGPWLKWFASYFTSRSFSVRVDQAHSSVQTVAYGVSQGSVLGPLLYLLYTNDVNQLLDAENTTAFSYADDIAIVVSHVT